MQTQAPALQAIGFMFLSMTLIVSSDAAAKFLTGSGFSSYFVAWTRFARPSRSHPTAI